MFHTFEVFFNHFLSYSCFRQIAIILIAIAGGSFRGLMGLCLAILLFASTVISVKYLYLGFDAITPQSVFGTLLVVFLILSAYICSRKGGL